MMKKAIVTLAAAVAAGPSFGYDFGGQKPSPLIGEALGGSVSEAAKPAYQLIEGISDGAYWLLRSQFIARILPGGLAGELSLLPDSDSYAAFQKSFAHRQERYLNRLREAYPATEAGRAENARELASWRNLAISEQKSVALNALADSLLDRYELPRFGRDCERYARQRRHWTPQFVAVASVVAGAIAYGNGVHADLKVKRLAASLDMRPGHEIAAAARGDGSLDKVAEVELGVKDSRVTLAAAWQVKRGALRSESVGVKYRLRY